MATRSEEDTWQPGRRSLWLLVAVLCGVLALIVWGVIQNGANQPAGAPTPRMNGTATTSSPSTPSPSPYTLPTETLRATAGKVLDTYYNSPTEARPIPDLSNVASPEVINSIKEHWTGFPPDMSVKASITFPNLPVPHDDGTVSLDARVETVSMLGDPQPEENLTTAIVHFTFQNEQWFIYAIEEVEGDATGAGE